jgi:hypothetical protein
VSSLGGSGREQSLEADAPSTLRSKTDRCLQIIQGVGLAERSADLVAEFPEIRRVD